MRAKCYSKVNNKGMADCFADLGESAQSLVSAAIRFLLYINRALKNESFKAFI